MHTWRPQQQIKVKTLGLHWLQGCLLAFEVYDDAGNIKGVRPLGGSIEFGESWQDALIREFHEELQIKVSIVSAPFVMENIYIHEGVTGHEVLYIAEVAFPTGAFDGEEKITFAEDNGELCTARWFDLADLNTGGPELYPTGLKERVLHTRKSVLP